MPFQREGVDLWAQFKPITRNVPRIWREDFVELYNDKNIPRMGCVMTFWAGPLHKVYICGETIQSRG